MATDPTPLLDEDKQVSLVAQFKELSTGAIVHIQQRGLFKKKDQFRKDNHIRIFCQCRGSFSISRPGVYKVYSSPKELYKPYTEWDFGQFDTDIAGVKVIPSKSYSYESLANLIAKFGRSTVYLIIDTKRVCDAPIGTERVV